MHLVASHVNTGPHCLNPTAMHLPPTIHLRCQGNADLDAIDIWNTTSKTWSHAKMSSERTLFDGAAIGCVSSPYSYPPLSFSCHSQPSD